MFQMPAGYRYISLKQVQNGFNRFFAGSGLMNDTARLLGFVNKF